MGLLRWRETTAGTAKSFLKAEIVNLNLDFMDLCEGRFWGGSSFYFNLSFSIHERIVKSNGWNYQLLAPNGVHIYCVDVEEAKEMAEVIFRRIVSALSEKINISPEPEQLSDGELAKRLKKGLDASKLTTEQFNRVMYKKYCRNTKHKTSKLFAFLQKRGIEGRVYYSRLRGMSGWMFNHGGCQPILIGSNYEQAIDMINSGTLDFYPFERRKPLLR